MVRTGRRELSKVIATASINAGSRMDGVILLVEKTTLYKMWVLRRILNPMGTVDAMEFLLDKLKYEV